eukprot:superscaffoldBa00000078_g1195
MQPAREDYLAQHSPVRHYDSVKWVSTDETSFFMEIAAMRAFKRLYRYITGANDNGVYIQKTPDVKMYVRSYGGWMTSMADSKKASSLSSALNSVGAEYKRGFHYAVGYNSPMTMFNRHNEVWFVAEDDPVCYSSEELESSIFS